MSFHQNIYQVGSLTGPSFLKLLSFNYAARLGMMSLNLIAQNTKKPAAGSGKDSDTTRVKLFNSSSSTRPS